MNMCWFLLCWLQIPTIFQMFFFPLKKVNTSLHFFNDIFYFYKYLFSYYNINDDSDVLMLTDFFDNQEGKYNQFSVNIRELQLQLIFRIQCNPWKMMQSDPTKILQFTSHESILRSAYSAIFCNSVPLQVNFHVANKAIHWIKPYFIPKSGDSNIKKCKLTNYRQAKIDFYWMRQENKKNNDSETVSNGTSRNIQ